MSDERSKSFKNLGRGSTEEARERRRTDQVELRKKERESQAMKRRNVNIAVLEDAVSGGTLVETTPQTAAYLEEIMAGIHSDHSEQQIVSTSRLRRLLSQADTVDNIVDAVIGLEVVGILVNFLDRYDAPTLQFEAAWCLTNIASGEDHHTKIVVKSGAVPKFVSLLSSDNKEVREQALWALGNIAGDGPKFRDKLLGLGIINGILSMLTPGASLALMRTATWTLANLCRGRPPPDFAVVRTIIPYICTLINVDDEQILIDAAWALSYLTDGENNQIQEVIDYNVVPRLVDLLSLGDHELQKPTLRALGNIVTGDEDQTQAVLECNPLPVLLRLLSSPREYIRKETSWALSNMLAGTAEQLQAVIDANIIPVLIRLITEGEFKVRREAAWAITNLICGGSDEQVKYVINQGCIQPLVDVLDSQDPKLMTVVLDGIREILRFGETYSDGGENMCAQWVEEAGGVPRIELLQHHENTKIYQKAHDIITTFFSGDATQAADIALEPAVADNMYTFQAPNLGGNGGFNL